MSSEISTSVGGFVLSSSPLGCLRAVFFLCFLAFCLTVSQQKSVWWCNLLGNVEKRANSLPSWRHHKQAPSSEKGGKGTTASADAGAKDPFPDTGARTPLAGKQLHWGVTWAAGIKLHETTQRIKNWLPPPMCWPSVWPRPPKGSARHWEVQNRKSYFSVQFYSRNLALGKSVQGPRRGGGFFWKESIKATHGSWEHPC